MVKCPETIEEIDELLRLLPLCRKTVYETAKAKIDSGVAYSISEAARQIADETGKSPESIRVSIQQEKRKLNQPVMPLQVCETDLQAEEVYRLPICSLHTGDQESYTPAKYIEAARKVMGGIDLDPASNVHAQKTVQAKTYYSKEDDGLNKPWKGNIFLNPPYSHPDIKNFVDKLLVELTPGQQAILLTNNNTDTNFFHDAARKAAAICFTKGRINFIKPDGSTSSPTNGQVFFYFGNNKKKFIDIFSEFGVLMEII